MRSRKEKWQVAVLEILQTSDKPMSAYAILGELRNDNPRIAPPTIYRTLSDLVDKGRAHRLESLNAYIACKTYRHEKNAVITICEDCGAVDEYVATDVLKMLSNVIAHSGFATLRHVIELQGVCENCGFEQTSA